MDKSTLSKYLDKYKEKSKKSKKFVGTGLKIVDSDTSLPPAYHNNKQTADKKRRQDVDDDDGPDARMDDPEEMPQIVAVVDERPNEIQLLEQFRQNSKWKTVVSEAIEDSRRSPSSERREVRKSRINSDSDASPPRRKTSRNNRRRDSDSDASPPRKRNLREDHHHRRRDSDSDTSPPRRRTARDDRRGRKNSDSDAPPRKRDVQENNRRRKNSDSDASPPRRKTSRDDRRGRRNSDSDASPPRKRDVQEHNRVRRDSDTSPPRRRENRNRRRMEKSESPPPTHKQRHTKTLEGKKAGLQTAGALRDELEVFQRQENERFQQMEDSVTGRYAKTKIRDRQTGRERDLTAENEEKLEENRKAAERKQQYDKWGKGMKQVEEQQERVSAALHEMSKPLARYKDDEDLDAHLRQVDREGDPMLKFLTKKKTSRFGGPAKPAYSGPPPPPNRFNIQPGYRWDGVDRSIGYEKQWFERVNSRKALQEESYKWSVEDL